MTIPLSVQLREGTQVSHRLAENTPFIRDFFAQRISVQSYRLFLVQLHFIYAALEQHIEAHRDHPACAKVYYPALFRAEALRKDLSYYYGDEGWRDLPPHAATAIYTERINTLSAEWAPGLVAHHYTRYLGDLSGGQALKRIVGKVFQPPDSQGLAFYRFDHIQDHDAFKQEYRLRLDSIAVDESDAQKIVAEANLAFELNMRVFDSILQ